MTAQEPMGTPDSGGLREAVEGLRNEARARMRAYPDHRDWTAWSMYEQDLTDALAAHPDPVPTPDSADDDTVGERGCRWSDARGRWEWEIRPGVSKQACGHLAHTRGGDLYMPNERPVVVTSATPDADDDTVGERGKVECDSICDAASGGSCFTPWCRCRCHRVRREAATPDADDTVGEREAHVLTEYGTTTCPVERVRANVDDGVCSACGTTGIATPDADDTPPPAAGDVEALAKVLLDHSAFTGFDSCRCGWRADRSGWTPVEHREHMAAAVLASDWLRADRATRDAASKAEASERIAQAIEALIYDPTRREAARIAREQARP